MAINQNKLHEFLGKAINDFGATFHAALMGIGDKLGLYKALAAGGPQTSGELAKRTNTAERYVREWLSNQAAGGYVNYDAANGKFHLSEEQAFALAWVQNAFSVRATPPTWLAVGFRPLPALKQN